ncbi:hypothetical protein IGI04_035796 [Brassica rapa subsp. trilocularis]|uniref:Uncharacterized protein n=1 Tax=Brassica rapa subsp. trilocularis TaxID=1813537 RepID=A0ABQ7LEY9_BRACM|nr:hypothetical protein IGI04_035796 [Brassica rapa subsp. trilocularis]
MSRGSVSIDVRTEVSIDIGWKMSVDGMCLRLIVVSEYRSTGLVSGTTVVVLSIDEERASLRIERSKLAGSGENNS